MLQIRPAQFDTLAAPFEAAFLARVRHFVQAQAPALVTQAGPHFEARLQGGLRDAQAMGVVSEREQVLHVVLCLIHGVGFASREAWAKDVVQARRDAGYASGLPQALMEAGHGVSTREG